MGTQGLREQFKLVILSVASTKPLAKALDTYELVNSVGNYAQRPRDYTIYDVNKPREIYFA